MNIVTAEHIKSRIQSVGYYQWPGTTLTICLITMENGFSVRGESACVDLNNFNKEVGETYAYKDAFDKLWQLEGYLLADALWVYNEQARTVVNAAAKRGDYRGEPDA